MRKDLMLFDEMNDFMNSVFGASRFSGEWMKTDIAETDKEIRLVMDLPGVRKEDVKISLENSILTVSAERNIEYDKETNVVLKERVSSSVKRSFRLPSKITSENIHAKYDNGVLTVVIDKPEDTKPANINIDVV